MLSFPSVVRSSANRHRNSAPNPTISRMGPRMLRRMGVIICGGSATRRRAGGSIPVLRAARKPCEPLGPHMIQPSEATSGKIGSDPIYFPVFVSNGRASRCAAKIGVGRREMLLPVWHGRWHAIATGGHTMAHDPNRSSHDQALESRLLLAFTHTGADGTVFLDGTPGSDQITVTFHHTGAALVLNGETELFDEIPNGIHVDGGDGNDTIEAQVSPGPVVL